MTTPPRPQEETLFGHPVGLYTLFFAEMWERFSFYGMRALLTLYLIKGFLAMDDEAAYGVYGAYGALVYATPFIGGIIADRILGARRTVIIGAALMAAGHLLMGVNPELGVSKENSTVCFYTALALLICGNGCFKPNISTIVGSLYPQGSPRRDAGFTIFYMGINLGAAIAPLLCGYIGEKYGWHYGFGLATVGMLVGLAVFAAPRVVTQALVLGGSLATAAGLFLISETPYQLAVNGFVAVALVIAAGVATLALTRGGLPEDAGLPANPEVPGLRFGGVRLDQIVYLGILVAVPVCAFLVQYEVAAKGVINTCGLVALAWLLWEAFRSPKVERERLFVVLILIFFSMLFWAFFEQAGSSMNNFTDRNVDRVFEERVITQADVGQTLQLEPSQGMLGFTNGDDQVTLDELDKMRANKVESVHWEVSEDDVGMEVGEEMPASTFQAANPIFILLFGLAFTALWQFMGARGLEPSTPVKFALGLIQLGLGFGALYVGAQQADKVGMVAMNWLILGYLLHTTGELCLSPVGLSMVTRLSPARIVSTVMGAWFLATSFSHLLAAGIAKLTGVTESGEGGAAVIPPPVDTVDVYGHVFMLIGLVAVGSGIFCLLLSPLLKKWMHGEGEGGGGGH